MNLAPLDWLLVAGFGALVIGSAILSRPLVQGVADFLAAGRTAGRYLLSVSQGMAALGAISVIGMLEMNYLAGLPQTWWNLTTAVVVLVIAATGWVVYRFRETRCLTLSEFFERRYSRGFRIFAGSLAYLSGIINFGIFPAVEARFFIYFVGLPPQVPLLGLQVPTFPLVMLVLLGVSLGFVFVGGQIAVLITDFLQGLFVNVVFIATTFYLLSRVPWDQIAATLASAPAGASLLNPYHTSQVRDFDFWYFFIGAVGVVYGTMSWQGTQGYNASAKSAHEARMASLLFTWRIVPQSLVLLVVPIAAYAILRLPQFSTNAAQVGAALQGAGSETVQSQLRVPVVLTTLLPAGFMGAFAAMMLAASVTTLGAYMHSWGSILVQDVLVPLRRRPLAPARHLAWLRGSILGVGLFAFGFGLLFQQSQHIFLFFAVTGAIFAGGSGAVIIGGLYWRRGTTAAAYTAMLLGAGISVGGIIVHQLRPGFFVTGQVFWGIAMAAASVGYAIVSLLGRAPVVDLDALRHRRDGTAGAPPGPAAAEPAAGAAPSPGAPGSTRSDFSRTDRLLRIATYAWTLSWLAVFAVGTVVNLTREVSDAAWARFWHVYLIVQLVVACVVVVWFAAGGVRDLRSMLRALRRLERDATDDGFVGRRTP